jgi:hypothetical protein
LRSFLKEITMILQRAQSPILTRIVQVLCAGVVSLLPLDASLAQQYIAVDVQCCGITQKVRVPAKSLRGLGGPQIGFVTVSCKQFFEGETVTYPGGWPQEKLGRAVNFSSVNTSAVRQALCEQLRDQGSSCPDMAALCAGACKCEGNARAAELFEGLYAGLADGSRQTPASKIAVSRFLSNCATEKLLDELSNMPCPAYWNAGPGCRLGKYIRFKLRFRDRDPNDPEAGSVMPGTPFPNPDPQVSDPAALRNFVYTISVTHQKDGEPGEVRSFPAPQNSCFTFSFSDGASDMAATIYHEMLHIWWMNKNQTDYYNSGHGTALYECGNYQPVFRQKLEDFYQAMEPLEKCLKAKPTP